MSTKAGDQLTINFKDCDAVGTGQTNYVPARMFCALNYDAVLNIRDSGVELLD